MVSLHHDTDLLQRYVDEGSHDAFAALVDRYAGLVYHTAKRRTGDAELAKEVSQTVFALLARRAGSLSGEGGLAGWLHRTALLQASNAWRRESRHRDRVRRFAEQSEKESDVTSDKNTHLAMLAQLDESLERLSERDRRAIWLRFYEEHSLAEVGRALGKSEEAARKQVSRALEKLARLLSRQGATVSSVALGTLLAQQMTKAAPMGLAGQVAPVAFASAPALSQTALLTNALLTMKSTHALLAAGLLVSLPLTWQQWTLSQERHQLVRLREQWVANGTLTVAKGSASPIDGSLLAEAGRGAAETKAVDLKQLARDLKEAQEGDFQLMAKNAEFFNRVEAEGSGRLAALIEETLQTEDFTSEERRLLLRQFFDRLQDKDPKQLTRLALKAVATETQIHSYLRHLKRGLQNWAATDPQSAQDWFETALSEETFDLKSLNGADQVRDKAKAALVAGLLRGDRENALTLYESLSISQKMETLIPLGEDAVKYPDLRDSLITLTASLESAHRKQRALEPFLRLLEVRDEAGAVIEAVGLSGKNRAKLYGQASLPSGYFTKDAFLSGLEWAREEAPAGHGEDAVVGALTHAAQHRQDRASLVLEAFETLLPTFEAPDDQLVKFLQVDAWRFSNPEGALRLATKIRDPERRVDVAAALVKTSNMSLKKLSGMGFPQDDMGAIEASVNRPQEGSRVEVRPTTVIRVP